MNALEYLKIDCAWKIGVGAGISLIRFWSRAYLEYTEHATTEEELHAGAEAASKRVGIRCLAAEILTSEFAKSIAVDKKLFLAGEIARAGMVLALEPQLRNIVDGMGAILPGIQDMMRWFVAPGVPFNLYQFQADYPAIVLRFSENKTTKKVPAKDIISSLKSKGQRHALAQLSSLAKIRHEFGDTIHNIPIRPGACLVGMSGSGKTFVARAFASASGWGFYECTVSGWCVQNAKSDSSSWTLTAIREMLTAPIVVFVDEFDKIKTVGNGSGGSDNWYRGCQAELMQLLDRSMGDVPLSENQRENLRNSWIICAGAFQEIFRKKIGGDVLFDESLEVELTRADLEEDSGIPVELWNRVGEIISIRCPDKNELSRAYQEIEIALGIEASEKERTQAANEAVLSLQGFRGLEEYAIKCARAAISQK